MQRHEWRSRARVAAMCWCAYRLPFYNDVVLPILVWNQVVSDTMTRMQANLLELNALQQYDLPVASDQAQMHLFRSTMEGLALRHRSHILECSSTVPLSPTDVNRVAALLHYSESFVNETNMTDSNTLLLCMQPNLCLTYWI